MAANRAKLIGHPVRTRILAALMGRRLATQQIAALLPDVPLPSLYRHVRLLADNGVLAEVDEVRVNGVLSKVYAVREGQTRVTAAEVGQADAAEQLRQFTVFLDTLADTFRAYLETGRLDPDNDPLHCLMSPLHLSPAEYREFIAALDTFLEPWRALPLGDERRRVLFAHIALPDRPDPPLP